MTLLYLLIPFWFSRVLVLLAEFWHFKGCLPLVSLPKMTRHHTGGNAPPAAAADSRPIKSAAAAEAGVGSQSDPRMTQNADLETKLNKVKTKIAD